MSIVPLPVFEADADPSHRDGLTDQEIYERLEPPKTIVVRFGAMKLVGEFPYDGQAKPGCGTKMVARTHRGTEIAEMLTTTCENAGCAKSVTRQEMLDYIDNSGGKDYPFHTNGRILRVATIEDLNRQSALNAQKGDMVKSCKAEIREMGLRMKLVEVEPILGEELLTFYYMAEERVDFRELVRRLAGQYKTRIEMRQVGARDEARLVADYERCGQHCCCKNFLKVLKPISMRAAKMQKATLDPLKISGRCGRLMCCLRYEDQTYKRLKANLPKRNTRVGTEEGPGIVVEAKILVQLVLVRLEHDGREIAVPVEELLPPDQCPDPVARGRLSRFEEHVPEPDPLRGMSEEEVAERVDVDDESRSRRKRDRGRRRTKHQQQDAYREQAEAAGRGQPRRQPPGAEPDAQKNAAAEEVPSAGPSEMTPGAGPGAKPGAKPEQPGRTGRRKGRKPGAPAKKKKGRRRGKAKGKGRSDSPATGSSGAAEGGSRTGKPRRKRARRRRGTKPGGGGSET